MSPKDDSHLLTNQTQIVVYMIKKINKHNTTKLFAVIIPFFVWFFTIASYCGWFDIALGMHHVRKFSDALETSYGYADRIIRPGHPAWKPTVELIKRYGAVKISQDRTPTFIGRFPATASAKQEVGGRLYQWTAPTTPVAIFYYTGFEGDLIPNDQFVIVGDLGQLKMWISQRISDFTFFWLQLILGGFSLIIGWFLWLCDQQPKSSEIPGAHTVT